MTEDVLAERFRPEPTAVSGVRRFLRAALAPFIGAGDKGADLAEMLLLAGNELATNAVLHARTDFTVRVRHSRAVIRVEVSDGNTRMPQPCLAPDDATSGRGLAIIERSGLTWGVHRHAGGKTIWVEAVP